MICEIQKNKSVIPEFQSPCDAWSVYFEECDSWNCIIPRILVSRLFINCIFLICELMKKLSVICYLYPPVPPCWIVTPLSTPIWFKIPFYIHCFLLYNLQDEQNPSTEVCNLKQYTQLATCLSQVLGLEHFFLRDSR